MKNIPAISFLSLCAPLAFAHVSVAPASVEAGQTWRGVVHVSHGCDGAPTTAVEVNLPATATQVRASASLGWQMQQSATKVAWTAEPGNSLPVKEKGEFPLEFQAPRQTGPMWIGVTQKCGATAINWFDVPSQGTSTEGMKTPAALVQVVSAQGAAALGTQPSVDGAWIRASVPGQQATGAFMRIIAKEPTKLVGASSPAAGTAEVHEMKMEGDVMRMRPAGAIDLPVGKPFELKPGGYHLMLQDLKGPLKAGSTVALTLVFRDAKGAETRKNLNVPVALAAPSMPSMDHKH